MTTSLRSAAARLLDPNEVEGVLSQTFYDPEAEVRSSRRQSAKVVPEHYKVICISMYKKDLQELDTMVDALKARGMTKANRSALIRYALQCVDLERVPRGL